MKRYITVLLCLAMAASLCACAAPDPAPTAEPSPAPTQEAYTPVSFLNNGTHTTVSSLPQKVVTAGPNCTEVFCALGLADRVIGKSMENHSLGALDEYAEDVAAIPTLSVGYPTAKQIIDSGCDFLYASAWIFDDELTVSELQSAGITVYVSQAESFETLFKELRELAKIFLVENSESLVSQLSIRLEAVSDKLADVEEPRGVFVLDSFIGDKLYTAGSANMESACISAAGGANVFATIQKEWDAVEPEELIVADPYCIVIHDYEGSDYDGKVAALKADPLLSQLDCVKNECFVRLSLEDALPGMRSVTTVETIAHALYPELF